MKKTYQSTGVVIGHLWGGGKGTYPAVKLQAPTKKELIKTAKERLKNGSLDSGMGYQSLIGCLLNITCHKEKKGGWKKVEHLDSVVLGDLTENEIKHLLDSEF